MLSNIIKKTSSIRREAAKQSLLVFAELYLPHHLKYSHSAAHLEIYELLFSALKERGKKISVAAPRGFGKSTQITLILVLYCLCFGYERFIILISDVASQAGQILENIKLELTQNEKLMLDFPEVFERNGKPKPPRWTQYEIETLNKIKILALGSGQQIRGRKFGIYRPTLVIADDIENADNTSSPDQREKTKDWYNKAILKVGSEETNYIFLGTLCHPQCLLSQFLDPNSNHIWIKKRYQAIISDASETILWERCLGIYNNRDFFEGKQGIDAARRFYEANKAAMLEGAGLLWPQRWDYFDLRILQEEDPISFSSEYQNIPLDPRTQIFTVEERHHWTDTYKSLDELLRQLGGDVAFYMACDPSTGKDTARGDYSAIIIIAADLTTKIKYVIVADIKRRSIDQTIEDMLSYAMRYRFRKVAVESNQFQELVTKKLEEESLNRGIHMPIEHVENTSDKIQRIQALQPYTKNGTIQFDRNHKLLLDQLTYFPKEKYDDGPDALEMVFRLSHTTRKRLMTTLYADGSYRAIYNE